MKKLTELYSGKAKSVYPTFLGLSGDAQATQEIAQEFKVVYQQQAGVAPDQHMEHSTGTYIFDTAGKLRVYVSNGKGRDMFAHDIAELLKTR